MVCMHQTKRHKIHRLYFFLDSVSTAPWTCCIAFMTRPVTTLGVNWHQHSAGALRHNPAIGHISRLDCIAWY